MLKDVMAKDLERVFSGSGLFANWPNFRNELQPRMEALLLTRGQPIFSPGSAPRHLYLVISGSVIERSRRDRNGLEGPIWLELRHEEGSYFGQHALFAEHYDSFAVAAEETTIVMMTAADLRAAMEHNPDLSEELLREKLAGRLRRIPLLRGLEDWQVRRLAQVIDDKKNIARGDRLPLEDNPGVWIVDWGQIAVTGPVSYGGTIGEPWRLTSGNFVVTGGREFAANTSSTLRAGKIHVANSAEARVRTHVFYLAIAHADRLVAAFDSVRYVLEEPFDIVNHLKSIAETERLQKNFPRGPAEPLTQPTRTGRGLFSAEGMTSEHLAHLAQFCGWEFVPAEQNITTQGAVGHSFVILVSGKAVVSALDEHGRPRPRNTLLAGDSYGETSLLEGKSRDATVRAVRGPQQSDTRVRPGAEIITLDRRDLQYAFLEKPDLWNQRIPLFRRSVVTKEERLLYSWQAEGETVIWRGRGHWLWAAWPIFLLIVAYSLAAAGVHFFSGSASAELIGNLLIGALIVLPIAYIIILNYLDDYYAVTNRRVTRRDRQLFIYEARVEAPIEAVQDITSKTDFWAALLDFGNVTVRTADKATTILFAHVPQPDLVQKCIAETRAEALIAQRGLRAEALRRGLMSELDLSLMIPERTRALGSDVTFSRIPRWIEQLLSSLRRPRSSGVQLPSRKRARPGWLLSIGQKIPTRLRKALKLEPTPMAKSLPTETTYVWRKHWLNLLGRAGRPALIVIFVLVLLVVGLNDLLWLDRIFNLSPTGFLGGWVVVFLAACFWLWWEWTDYRNDLYVLTEDKLIDILKRPLALSAEQRESNLDRVQTVDAKQKTIWANLLNYGDVVIRTAAADEGFDFIMVPNPKLVQAIIFQRVGALRRKQEEQQTAKQQQAILEGLQVYHQLREAKSETES